MRDQELNFRSDLLREEIRKAGLSQNRLAKILNIDSKTLSQKMNGLTEWKLNEIQCIQATLKHLDVSLVFNLKRF